MDIFMGTSSIFINNDNKWGISHCHVLFAEGVWHASGRSIASWWISMRCLEEAGQRSIPACLVLVQHARLRAVSLWLARRVPRYLGRVCWVSAKTRSPSEFCCNTRPWPNSGYDMLMSIYIYICNIYVLTHYIDTYIYTHTQYNICIYLYM